MTTVAGIVLAAGASLRMGEPKQLLPYGETTLLNHAIGVAESSTLDFVVVVTGANAEMVEDSIEAERATVVRNPDFELPNMMSVIVGAKAVAADAYLTLPCDTPGINSDIVDAVVERWRTGSPWAIVTAYRGSTGHPFLLSRAALHEAADVEGPKVLYRFLAYDDTGRVTRVAVDRPPPADVNTREDYRELVGDEAV